jgi:hypothetical protein
MVNQETQPFVWDIAGDFFQDRMDLSALFFQRRLKRWFSCPQSMNLPRNSHYLNKPIFISQFQPIKPKDYS